MMRLRTLNSTADAEDDMAVVCRALNTEAYRASSSSSHKHPH
jgi:hypothetical protein